MLSPGDSDDKECACNAGEQGSIPGLGRSHGEENGYPLQYWRREARWAIVHGCHKDTTEQLTHFEDFRQWKRLGSRAGQTWFKSFLTL